MKPQHWRLFPKYATLIIALVGGVLLVSGALSLLFSWREIRSHLVALQAEKAQGAATRIEQYILDIEHQLGWTAFPRMDPQSDPIEHRRIEYEKLLRQVPAVTDLAWIGPDGRERLRVSRLAMNTVGAGTDFSLDPAVVAARGGKTYFGPVNFRKGTEPYMTIARRAGGDGGVTLADVNLKFVWDVVSRLKIGVAGVAYVVDAGGTLIAHPDISLVLKKTDLRALPQVAALDRPEAAPAEARNLAGEEVFAAHARIPSLRWTVLAETPRREAFAPLYDSVIRLGALLVAALGVAAAASFFLARALVQPIRALQEGAARVGAGELDHRIEITTGDELQALAERFNRMAGDLKASYEGLERKVEERTVALKDALEQQTATAGVLSVISATPTDVQPVLDAIVGSASRLFKRNAAVRMVEEGMLRRKALAEIVPGGFHGPDALPIDRDTLVGAVALEGKSEQVTDTQAADAPSHTRSYAAALSYRSVASAPLVRDGVVLGVLTVSSPEPGALSDKQMALLATFADQAVIAIENVRLFHALEDKSRQLEAANRHKSEFLANMSHELRTPLNAIIGFSEVLTEQMFGELNDKQMEYLRDIHSSGQHLLNLINDVLDLSKIEAGKMELDLSCFDLGLLLEHSTTLVRERAQRHGLALTLEVGEGLGEWVGDARKLKQAVINLLSNAVKFTPAGGNVTLRARHLNGLSDRPGEWAEVSVIDTGIGIKPEDQALVFEEFRQASGDVLRKSEGTGLGLALVKRFVELHGGTVRLDSAPGQGSTFTLTLPQHEMRVLQ